MRKSKEPNWRKKKREHSHKLEIPWMEGGEPESMAAVAAVILPPPETILGGWTCEGCNGKHWHIFFCGFCDGAVCENCLELHHNMGLDEHYTIKETNDMLLNKSITEGSASLKNFTFLKPRHLGGDSCIADVVGFRAADAKMPYSDFLLDVKIGRQTYSHGMRENGEDLPKLAAKFGLDTDKWAGKKVGLFLEDYESSAGKKSKIIRVNPK